MLRSSWARSGRAEANDKTAIARLQVKKDSACSAKLELPNLRDFINNLLDLIPACLAEFLPVLAVKPRRSARGYKAAFFFLRLVLPLTQDQGIRAPTERVAICSLRLTCTLPIMATGGLRNPVVTSRGVRERPESPRKRIGTESVQQLVSCFKTGSKD